VEVEAGLPGPSLVVPNEGIRLLARLFRVDSKALIEQN